MFIKNVGATIGRPLLWRLRAIGADDLNKRCCLAANEVALANEVAFANDVAFGEIRCLLSQTYFTQVLCDVAVCENGIA